MRSCKAFVVLVDHGGRQMERKGSTLKFESVLHDIPDRKSLPRRIHLWPQGHRSYKLLSSKAQN
jgi:hypothetical protein